MQCLQEEGEREEEICDFVFLLRLGAGRLVRLLRKCLAKKKEKTDTRAWELERSKSQQREGKNN